MTKLTYQHTIYAGYLGYITQAVVNNLAPLLFLIFQDSFGLPLQKITLLITVNFCVQLLVDLLSARFVDRIGYRVCIVAAHILCAAGLVGMAVLPALMAPYPGLLTAVVLYAVGGGLIEVLVSPIVEACPTARKAAAMSLLHSFYCWGQVSVVLLSTLFFTLAGIKNWRILAALWAVVPFANIFLFMKVPLCPFVSEGGEEIPLKKLFNGGMFLLFCLLMISAGASELAASQWASLFAESGLGVSKTVGDLLGPCMFAVLMGSARLWYGIFGKKIKLAPVIAASSVLCIVSYGLMVFSGEPWLSLAGCGLCGLSVGIMWPGVFSLASEQYPSGGTSMFAALALAGDIGCSAGPGLVGIFVNASENGAEWIVRLFPNADAASAGLRTGLLFAAVFPLIMLLGVLFLISIGKQMTSK